MATSSRRARRLPNEETAGSPQHFDQEQRRVMMGNAIDHAMHAMNLAYTNEDPTLRPVLASEAVMWSNLVVADALYGIATLIRQRI